MISDMCPSCNLCIYLSSDLPVDHAVHPDAGVHPLRGRSLRGGRRLRAERSGVPAVAMVSPSKQINFIHIKLR